MLYECYRCGKLVDEDEGAVINAEHAFFIKTMVFICKNCMREEGRKKFDEAKKKR